MLDEPKLIYVKTAKDWRKWLEKNHGKENSVKLVRYKNHTGKPSVTYKEALDEAICFGWIDTTINRIDEERYSIRFVKRKKNAIWSKNTLSYAKRLKKEGKMAPDGLKAYELGLKRPVIFDLPKNPTPSEDLKKALAKNAKAKKNFEAFAPSYRRYYIHWIEHAKRPETRAKRIKYVFERARDNLKPNQT